MQPQAGVSGCRVGFNGERIHFGASGCWCVGGSKNRGMIDHSAEIAFIDTTMVARETIENAPRDIGSLACTVCSGVRNIVRVSLGFSTAGLAYIALNLIEMCSLLSCILHAFLGQVTSLLSSFFPSFLCPSLCVLLFVS